MSDEIRVYVINRGRKNLYMRFTDPVTGKDLERSTGTNRKREAERIAAKWEAELQDGRYKVASRASWAEFRERFEDEKLAAMSDNYAAVMNATFNHFEELGIARVRDIQAETLSRFQAHLRSKKNAKESTIRCYLKHLRAALSWAEKMGFIREVPTIDLPQRARQKSKRMKGRPITGEEFDRMLAKVRTVTCSTLLTERTRLVIRRVRQCEAADAVAQITKLDRRIEAIHASWTKYLRGLWLSGLRLEESLVLSWDDDTDFCVDLSGKHPRFRIWAEGQKSKKDELLPMTPDFALFLLEAPDEERRGRVFQPLGHKGRPVKPDAVSRMVSKIGKAAGVITDASENRSATAHDLRRSFGTRWSKRVKPAVLQGLMRHADIKTTMEFYVDQDADDVAADLWRDFGGRQMQAGATVRSGSVLDQSAEAGKDQAQLQNGSAT